MLVGVLKFRVPTGIQIPLVEEPSSLCSFVPF